jgi:epidermal growth factor receptor substrate 15
MSDNGRLDTAAQLYGCGHGYGIARQYGNTFADRPLSLPEHAILNLTADEKRAYGYLFSQADKDQLGVVTGENAVNFFERTQVSPNVLGEIWQLADSENRGLLTKPGFCMVLRLIGHYQAGREPTAELAFKPSPIPKFEGLPIPGATTAGSGVSSPSTAGFPPNPLQPQVSGQPPIRVPPLDPMKVQQYSGLFERSGAQNGQLDGATAKAIFERAGLPNEVLGRIWMLADREQKGALDQTEFIVAMHLLTSMKTRAMGALPNILPPGLYDAAARRGIPNRQASGPTAIPRQVSGNSAGIIPRTQSPLARQAGYGTPPVQSAQPTGTPWLITPADKVKFDSFFNSIDVQRRGILTGEQAVSFFSDSRLPEETLASIWDLADINSEGQLNKDEFAVAMYLIRQQRAPNPPPLPAFLPPALVPPTMRKQQQQTQSTAPAFDNANNTSNLPKSAADDLFGLDEPSPPQAAPQVAVLQPQVTGASASRDPFGGSQPGSPVSPQRFQPPSQLQSQQTGFKPFMPTSAFGASLASQNTGGSFASNQNAASRGLPLQQQTSGMDDLLGDSDANAEESNKLTNETTELANMSNQIGNLRTQMEQTQSNKNTTQADLNTTSTQKRDLEIRLQQFRTQYEQEVRAVKDLEQQLAASRDSTKKLGQELAMLEGNYQDLQTQHQTVSQALQADQQENSNLKQRISQINAEVAKLKPEIEKLKLDARQQKGMVSINKKQLTTGEGDRDRLQGDKASLEREVADWEEQARNAPQAEPASNVVSPAASVMSANNPFFRKDTTERSMSPTPPAAQTGNSAPNPSAFDAIFGPSAAFAPNGQSGSGTATPPTTSFVGRSIGPASAAPAGMSDSVQSVSSYGEPTPSATPPLSEQAKASPLEPPPPPENRQFSASHLPVVSVDGTAPDSETSSTRVVPPASRAGGIDTPREAVSSPALAGMQHVSGSFPEDPTPETAAQDGVPGAFPDTTPITSRSTTPAAAKDDFDSAFAGFGSNDQANHSSNDDPFGSSTRAPTNGASSEFPEIKYLEPEDSDSEAEVDRGFDDDFTSASPPQAQLSNLSISGPSEAAVAAAGLPGIEAQKSPPTHEESDNPSRGGQGDHSETNQFPPEFGGLLPSREDPTSPTLGEATPAQTAVTEVHELQPSIHTPPANGTASLSSFPAPPGPSSETFYDATSRPISNVTDLTPAQTSSAVPAKNAFDDFDEFDDLAEAKEADKTGSEFDFESNEPSSEFNPAFDSPAASMTTTMTSSQQTPVAASRSLHQESNGFGSFAPSVSTSSAFGSSTNAQSSNSQHDWDAIFSGLDGSNNVDTSLPASDPWGTSTSDESIAPAEAPSAPPPIPASKPLSVPDRGGAITPGTEHDDPILKRLTGMGYPRMQALDALEKFDYDINRVSLLLD